jgi:lipid-binding SYLF domain-containing protein
MVLPLRRIFVMFPALLFPALVVGGGSSASGRAGSDPPAATASGEETQKTDQLVEKAGMTLDDFLADPKMEPFRHEFASAKGILISPQVLEGAFVWGVSGGSGVFLSRIDGSDQWSPPAFYTMGEVSFGLQAGGKSAQVILLAMTDRGVAAFMGTSFKLGADVSAAAGPVGAGVSAGTANLSADILIFSISEGLYGGLSLGGAVMAVRNGWNEAYYDRPGITAAEILVRRDVVVPQSARALMRELSKADE